MLNHIEVALLASEDENLQTAEDVIVRMTDLLNLFSEPDDPGEIDLLKIIKRVGKLAEKAHSGLKVKIQSQCKGVIRVRGARLLSVVFDNLFRNAAEHSRGHIEVCVTISQQGNMIDIEVSDNGPGIPEEIRQGLFKKGVSTTGGGYGLYLARTVVEGYDGSIKHLETKVGTTFRITLPRS